MNSESLYIYIWIYIHEFNTHEYMNSCSHFIYEFIQTMNSYDHFMHEFICAWTHTINVWIHVNLEFIWPFDMRIQLNHKLRIQINLNLKPWIRIWTWITGHQGSRWAGLAHESQAYQQVVSQQPRQHGRCCRSRLCWSLSPSPWQSQNLGSTAPGQGRVRLSSAAQASSWKTQKQGGAEISSKMCNISSGGFGWRDSNYTWFTLRTRTKSRLCLSPV